MGLSGAARPAGSELPGTLTALLVHGQSRAHARVQAHSHTHMHTGTCVHGPKAHAPTLILTRAPHTCVLTRTGEHGHAQLYTHSCPPYAGAHVCAQHLRMCAHVHLWTSHAHTHRRAHTGVHTFTRRPTTPGLGEGPGNSSRRSTSGRWQSPGPPRAEAGPPGPPESRPPSPPLHPCDPICNKKPDAEIGENCSLLKYLNGQAVISQMESTLPQTRPPAPCTASRPGSFHLTQPHLHP